jgi:hypothetical protein
VDEFSDGFVDESADGNQCVDEDEQSQALPVWSDEEFVQDTPEPYPSAARAVPGMMTGREMLGGNFRAAGRHSDQFERGMYVTHPDYGRGVIVSISGTGLKRSAKVEFMNDTQQRSFYLAHSPLQLATSAED